MKTTIFENQNGMEVSIQPETPAEVAMLARFTLNAKKESPDVFLELSNDNPRCSIWMRKVNKKSQNNYLKPGLK